MKRYRKEMSMKGFALQIYLVKSNLCCPLWTDSYAREHSSIYFYTESLVCLLNPADWHCCLVTCDMFSNSLTLLPRPGQGWDSDGLRGGEKRLAKQLPRKLNFIGPANMSVCPLSVEVTLQLTWQRCMSQLVFPLKIFMFCKKLKAICI